MVSVLPTKSEWTIGEVSNKNKGLNSCYFHYQTDANEDKVLMKRSCDDIPKRLSFAEKWVSYRIYFFNIYTLDSFILKQCLPLVLFGKTFNKTFLKCAKHVYF